MTEPVLIIHGVANHEEAPFLENVAALQGRLSSDLKLIPVFWGKSGGQTRHLEDCLPVFSEGEWQVRAHAREESQFIPAAFGEGRLSQTERTRMIVAAADPVIAVRSGDAALRIERATTEALDESSVLRYIDDPETLAAIGEAVRSAVVDMDGIAEEGDDEYAVRDGVEATRNALSDRIGEIAKAVIKGIDKALGKIVNDQLGSFSQRLRQFGAVPFASFFGDIVAYQARKADIHGLIWAEIDKHAPGYGTKERPINAIAHSLGGVILFDAAVEPQAEHRQLWLRSLTTFGSQAAFFHLIDPRRDLLRYDGRSSPVKLPPSIARWTNLWDPMDLLAFTAGTVFRLADDSRPLDIPVQTPFSLLADEKGWAHSIYWRTPELVEAVEKTLVKFD